MIIIIIIIITTIKKIKKCNNNDNNNNNIGNCITWETIPIYTMRIRPNANCINK